ncbi:MAG: Aminopeptidase YwaD precursor [Firmicutes bacterium ADurb.Bin182]|nr:MAG: Aminopeptidase YwaD precursor [Firmicutes bacterium ADurb.Bin182]
MMRCYKALIIAILLPIIAFEGCAVSPPNTAQVLPEVNVLSPPPAELTFTEQVFLELTDVKYEGREYKTEGNTAAGEYIAKTYASLGLEPFYEGSYYYGFECDGGIENNIIAYKQGTVGKSAVVICAHFDGEGNKDGAGLAAYDNASGVATMLTCAKLLADAPFESDIIYLATNVEEYGKQGASAISDYLSGKYDYINLFNIDCVGFAQYSGVMDVYGKDAPNNLSLAVADALGATQRDTGFSSDSQRFNNQNIAVCSLSDTKHDEPMHSPEDVRENVDCAKVEQLAVDLAAFIGGNGDRIFIDPDTGSMTPEEEIILAEINTLIATIPARYNLAYNEAYCCRLAADGTLELIMGIGKVDTVEKVNYLFPDVKIRERVGQYKLKEISINGEPYYGSCRDIWEHGDMQTLMLMGTPEDFKAGTFVEGEIYRFELPAPGSQLNSMVLQYSNGEESLIIQFRPYDALEPELAEVYSENANGTLGSEFEGYITQFMKIDGITEGYKNAVYIEKETGYVYLITAGNKYRSANDFAELLRELDMPAMLKEATGAQ